LWTSRFAVDRIRLVLSSSALSLLFFQALFLFFLEVSAFPLLSLYTCLPCLDEEIFASITSSACSPFRDGELSFPPLPLPLILFYFFRCKGYWPTLSFLFFWFYPALRSPLGGLFTEASDVRSTFPPSFNFPFLFYHNKFVVVAYSIFLSLTARRYRSSFELNPSNFLILSHSFTLKKGFWRFFHFPPFISISFS